MNKWVKDGFNSGQDKVTTDNKIGSVIAALIAWVIFGVFLWMMVESSPNIYQLIFLYPIAIAFCVFLLFICFMPVMIAVYEYRRKKKTL